jgi:cytochrome c oxidase subunit 2
MAAQRVSNHNHFDHGDLPMKFRNLASAFLLATSISALAGAHTAAAQAAPKRIEIVARRFDFTPGDITLKKGEPVVLVLTSKDVDHGLKFKDLNVNIKAPKGKTTETTFTPTKVGTFVGQCSVFCGSGHGAMKMTLHVTE